jgi:hypothetical protein
VDADCAPEFRCQAGECIARDTTTCDPDGVTQINPDRTKTSCVPFACVGIACGTTCDATVDCAPGYYCQTATRSCLKDSADAEESGCGCSLPPSRSPATPLVALALLFGAVLMWRRSGSKSTRARQRVLS